MTDTEDVKVYAMAKSNPDLNADENFLESKNGYTRKPSNISQLKQFC